MEDDVDFFENPYQESSDDPDDEEEEDLWED
jgi:hypothetical protein